MASDIRKELEKVKKRILFLGSAVETNLHKAIRALQHYDFGLAHKVKETDLEIDKTEVSLEDQCLKSLPYNSQLPETGAFVSRYSK